jgi:hypothetical protein
MLLIVDYNSRFVSTMNRLQRMDLVKCVFQIKKKSNLDSFDVQLF